MNSNLKLAHLLIENLIKRGIRHFVICAGSFNSPFVAVLSNTSKINIYHHFEERGAAFFALGLSKQLKQPVCVCVTSGTAVAECLPAMIEAFYALTALVVLSADRSKQLSGSGYPQAISQAGLFGSYAKISLDIENEADLLDLPDKIIQPIHCNVRFQEPIWGAKLETLPKICAPDFYENTANKSNRSAGACKFLEKYKRPIVIVENIPEFVRPALKKFLLQLSAPILAEARSGLRCDKELSPLLLKAAHLVLSEPSFDCVLRIGSVPTCDLWRALERDPVFENIPVCSITQNGEFPGLSRDCLCLSIKEESFEIDHSIKDHAWANKLLELDRSAYEKVNALLRDHPKSEPALVNWLSKQIPSESFLYLGNSLPVREWNDFADNSEKNLIIDANRGANGIDGQIATFFGCAVAAARVSNWELLGDLTMLYDINSLTIAASLPELGFCLAVINNRGGRIFERLPYFDKMNDSGGKKNKFLNVHEFDLAGVARGFGVAAWRITEPEMPKSLEKRMILEILPDEKQTRGFWQDYAGLK